MNCKQGDLAVIVNADNVENIGKIVRVLRLVSHGDCFPDINGLSATWIGDCTALWVVECDSPLSWEAYDGACKTLHLQRPFGDEYLRPIRDNDGEDETLQWAPVPTKETA